MSGGYLILFGVVLGVGLGWWGKTMQLRTLYSAMYRIRRTLRGGARRRR